MCSKFFLKLQSTGASLSVITAGTEVDEVGLAEGTIWRKPSFLLGLVCGSNNV